MEDEAISGARNSSSTATRYPSSSVNHVVAIEDGYGRYTMGNVDVDLERLRMSENDSPPDGNVCVICGGKANGIHFKVKSCPACNAFFRRSVVESRKYICKGNGDCDIGQRVRCICRACRLKKCLLAGMDPKAVQPHRDSIGRKQSSGGEKPASNRKSSILSDQIASSSSSPIKTTMNSGVEPAKPPAKSTDSSPKNTSGSSTSGGSSNAGQKFDDSPACFSETSTNEDPNVAQQQPSTSSYASRISSACSTTADEPDGLIELGLRAYDKLVERRRLIYGPRSIEKLMDGTQPEYRRFKGINHYRMTESMAIPIANMVEFIKAFPQFCQLSTADRITLFKHFGAKFIIFEKYYLSYKQGGLHSKRIYRQDYTYVQLEDVEEPNETSSLQNKRPLNDPNYFVPPHFKIEDGQLVDEATLVRLTTPYMHYALEMLIRPMEELHFTDVEFVGCTLSILFDASLANLSAEGREHVKQTRNQIYVDWMAYYESLGENANDSALKLGNSILIMPIVDSIMRHYQEHFHLMRVFGILEYDKMLDEFFMS